jgi:type IV pilus modification protein PilV
MKLRKYIQSGFSLIEALISMVVFAVGMLGLAGLYLSALKSQSDAKARSAITIYSSSMMDRMVLNPTAVSAGLYDVAYGANSTPTAAECAAYKAGNGYNSFTVFQNLLTPAALANAEKLAFYSEVACAFPSGDVDIQKGFVPTSGQAPCAAAMVAPATNPDSMVTIRIRWKDSRSTTQTGGGTGANSEFECYALSARVN